MFGFINVEFVARHKSCSDEQKSALKIISNILSDALIKIDAEKEISYMAYHDYLTKLPNRRLLNDRLKQAILLAGQANKRIGIFFIDLDGFKGVNDALGHEGGDILLRNFAGRLLEIVSEIIQFPKMWITPKKRLRKLGTNGIGKGVAAWGRK
jgi:predicted signal transduction protein with EAL and GGDEF domain